MSVSPTLRGFGILVLIAAVITLLQLGAGLYVILVFLQILFLLAIAYVLFHLWRRRREEISEWSLRARVVFYGGAALAIAAAALWLAPGLDFPGTGLEAVILLLSLAAGVFAMVRVWRDEHTYGY